MEFDAPVNHELKQNGKNIKVNKDNRREYVDLYIDFVLNQSVKGSFAAFAKGFYKVCSHKVLQLFHAPELMSLVVGNENYDWKMLEQCAKYKNEYHAGHPVIRRFWKVFHNLSYEEKKRFLLFLTGSDRVPILGMSQLEIIIQPCHVDDKHLPVAHTCFNLLDLPPYSTDEIMENKLKQAIQHSEGFGIV